MPKKVEKDAKVVQPKVNIREGEDLLKPDLVNSIPVEDRWADNPSLGQRNRPMAASTVAPPMNSKPVPGASKQLLANQGKPDNFNYEKEFKAQQDKDKAFHEQMEEEVAAQEKKDKKVKKQIKKELKMQKAKALVEKEKIQKEFKAQQAKEKADKEEI